MPHIVVDSTDPDTMTLRNARYRAEFVLKFYSGVRCRDPRTSDEAARADYSLEQKRIAARRWLTTLRRIRAATGTDNVIPMTLRKKESRK